MSFSSEAQANSCLKSFHLLRKDHPDENILFSPLNISAALQLLLYSSRGKTAAQIEKVLSNNEGGEESRQHSGELTNLNASEVRPGQNSTNHSYAKEALCKPVAEDCVVTAGPPFPLFLLSPETDARQVESNWASIPRDITSQMNSGEGISSSFVSCSKCIPQTEAGEILSQVLSSPTEQIDCNLDDAPESQESLIKSRNVAAENESLCAFCRDGIAAEMLCGTSAEEFKCAENGMQQGESAAKTGTSPVASRPTSEMDKRKLSRENQSLQTGSDTIPQTDTEGVVLNLLGRESNNVLSPAKPSQEGKLQNHNQVGHLQSSEELSESKSLDVSHASSPLPVSHAEAFQEVKRNEDNDFRAKDGSFPPPETNGGLECNNLVSSLVDISSQFDSEETVSSDFLPQDKDFPGRFVKEIINPGQSSPGDKGFHNQLIGAPENQDGLLSNVVTNPSCIFPSMENAAMLNDVSVQGYKQTMIQIECEESAGDGNSVLVSLPKAEVTNGQQQSNTEEESLTCCKSDTETGCSSHDLPWHKCLLGRKQRESLRRAIYPLGQNAFENVTLSPEIKKENRSTSP